MKRVVVFGVFDKLHPGHNHFLHQAKLFGDELVVCLARDTIVAELKGRPPKHPEIERREMVIEHPDVNGVFNTGTGKDRSWNALAAALFNAMGLEPNIEYIPMPDSLKDRYQYFTRAEMEKLSLTGCPVEFTALEDGVGDYVKNYLLKEDVFL